MQFHQEPKLDHYDAIIVGSGIGGLTTGALLAREGRSVLLVEQHDHVGGYAHSFSRGRYRFDSAVHMVGGCEPVPYAGGSVIHTLLETLGIGDRCEFLRLDPAYRVVLPGIEFNVPGGLNEFEQALNEAFRGEREGLSSFLQECLDIREQMRRADNLTGFSNGMLTPDHYPSLMRYRRATLQDVLDAKINNRNLKNALAALWPYLGLPPSQVSFLYYAAMLMSYVAERSYYCKGTFQRFANALASAITEREGEVLTRSLVRRIELDANGRAEGVILENGFRVRAPVVVSNADATQTIRDLVGPESFPPRYRRALELGEPSVSAFVIYAAGARVHAPGDPHETFYFPESDHDLAYAASLSGRPDWFTLTVPTLADPSLAPEGEELFVLTTLVPYATPSGWGNEKERTTEHLLDLAEQRIPGFRAGMRFHEAATPCTMERYTLNRSGAIYGWALSPKQVGPGRLDVRTPIEGLYLAGHWTRPGGGIYGVVMSGMQSARAILDDQKAGLAKA